MNYKKIIGYRDINNYNGKTISIFLMSFVYPSSTGYLKRMDLLITWANKRFKTVNLIIISNNTASQEIIDAHLKRCNNLFLIDAKSNKNPKLQSIKKIIYKVRTGRYPEFHSSLVLDESLTKPFQEIFNKNKTDYFLNTRNNFSGLIDFLPSGVKTVFDTQDIYSEMYKKYSLINRSNLVKTILCGYKEKDIFFKSEESSLIKYDKIIAISNNDFNRYQTIDNLKAKTFKIDSVGFEPVVTATATILDKKYDLLIIASKFIATQKGIDWMFNEVARYFKEPISLCIVGSIGEYVKDNKLFSKMLKVEIKGIVESIDLYYQKSKIVTLCMLDGTGTSVKGLEALAYGAAVVSTSAGVRFGGLVSGQHCLISDDPKIFAESIELLLNDTKQRHQMGVNALGYAKQLSSIDSTHKQLDAVFDL